MRAFNSNMSWKALLVAPLVVPSIFVVLLGAGGSKDSFAGFLFYWVCGVFFSYGAMVFMFLPGLFILCLSGKPGFLKLSGLGTALGILSFLPLSWVMYRSSGPDSGPPEGTYLAFLFACRTDPSIWLFPLAGWITGAAYYLLARNCRPETQSLPVGQT